MKNQDFPNGFKGKSLRENYNRLIQAKNRRLNESGMFLGTGFEGGKKVRARRTLKEGIEDSLREFDIDIDLSYAYQEGMSFDEFEDAVQTLISQEEVIYYRSAMEYLMANDDSLTESLGLAADMGYTPEHLNSEILATLLKQQHLQEQWEEIRDEVEQLFSEGDM